MTLFLEDPAPIWIGGLLLLTVTGIVYASLRTRGAAIAVGVVIVLMALGLVTEHFYLTPKERVAQSAEQLLATIEANDLDGVLDRISPAATTVRADAESLMPMFNVEKCRALSDLSIVVHDGENGATVSFKPFIKVTHERTGMSGAYADRISIDFVKESDRWLMSGYTASDDWRQGAAELGKAR